MPYKNIEDKRESNRRWKKNNKEKCNAYNKKWREDNREKVNGYSTKWRNNNAEKYKKSHTIISWKYQGMLCEDWDSLYEIYYYTWNCEWCNKEFKNKKDRCLDHDHATGEIRGILCNKCNVKDVLA